jgi:tripartite ATP-independent transporter DctP family solute receptor
MHRNTRATGSGLGRRNVIASTLAVAGAAAGLAAPAIAQRARVLRFGSMLPADSIYHRACVMFGDELAKLSSNKLKIEVYPDSQLGTIPEMLSSVQVGSLQMTMAVSAWYSKFIKPLDAFTLPYLVSSADRLQTALGGTLGQRIAEMGEATGFQIIGYWLIGGRHIVNKLRPVNRPADCAGLKLRVINSQVYIQTFRALGATAVAMDPSELYLALQQGVVDGFEYPLPDLISYKFYEVSKYLSLDGHTVDFFLVSINRALWLGMSKEEQAMMAQAIRTAMDWQWRAQPDEIATSLTRLKTLMQVNDIAPADKTLFVEATRPVYQQFEVSVGRDFLDFARRELGSA